MPLLFQASVCALAGTLLLLLWQGRNYMHADSAVPIGKPQEPESLSMVPEPAAPLRCVHIASCGADTPCPLRTLLAREQRRMRGEYEIRLKELERERLHAEQDKAQVSGSRRHLFRHLPALLEEELILHVQEVVRYSAARHRIQRRHDAVKAGIGIFAAEAAAACAGRLQKGGSRMHGGCRWTATRACW